MALGAPARILIFVGVLAGIGLATGAAVKATRRLAKALDVERGSVVEGDRFVDWIVQSTEGSWSVRFDSHAGSGELCCYTSHEAAVQALDDLLDQLVGEPDLPDPEDADENEIAALDPLLKEGDQVVEYGRFSPGQTQFDAEVVWALVADPSQTYRALAVVTGVGSLESPLLGTLEQAQWWLTDEVHGPPWLASCGGHAQLQSHPDIGLPKVWVCPNAQSGATVARSWTTYEGRPAEWRVQKTADPHTTYIAQVRRGLDPLDEQNKLWHFRGAGASLVDALLWAFDGAWRAA